MKKVITIVAALTLIMAASAQTQEQVTPKQDRIRQQQNLRQRQQTCYIMQDGKVMLRDGKGSKPIDSEVTLDDGTKVAPNGTVTTKEGKKEAMKDGQCLSQNGYYCPNYSRYGCPNNYGNYCPMPCRRHPCWK